MQKNINYKLKKTKQNILPWHCTLGLTRQLQQQIGKQLQTVSQNAEASADPGKPSWKYISILFIILQKKIRKTHKLQLNWSHFIVAIQEYLIKHLKWTAKPFDQNLNKRTNFKTSRKLNCKMHWHCTQKKLNNS